MVDVKRNIPSQYKNSKQRNTNSGRKRRHKRNMTLYYLLVFIVASAVLVILSLTVFFNISNIEVTGESIYSNEEILSALNINQGDNLFRININKTEKKALELFVNIADIKIRRHLPDTLRIEITPCIPFVAMEYEGKYYELSRNGKIMSCLENDPGELMVIKGVEPISIQSGTIVHSSDEYKDTIIETLYDSFETYGLEDITEIDIEDRLNIKLTYKGYVPVELGTSYDLEYKVDFVKAVIDNYVDKNFDGKIVMVGNKFAQIIKNHDSVDNDSTGDIILLN